MNCNEKVLLKSNTLIFGVVWCEQSIKCRSLMQLASPFLWVFIDERFSNGRFRVKKQWGETLCPLSWQRGSTRWLVSSSLSKQATPESCNAW
ncbi:hypothetical protein CEXT_4071 [Caerostris extrusa]|uniref:Uncharacterized protein n=1 Tax=Caerostris extrusa TaxID=172846 RepID=A0AAV4US92_CAEEX|nr:hypothetical protein CEXT_4071 [Caerostris extrusa]